MTVVVDQIGKYRCVQNGVGGYAHEVRVSGQWHRFGNETGDFPSALRKLSRLVGHRDTDTPIAEWEAYYRVNV